MKRVLVLALCALPVAAAAQEDDRGYLTALLEDNLSGAGRKAETHIMFAEASDNFKAYGVPGTRMGWLVVRNPALHELFLAGKEQIAICGSVVDEWIAEQILARKQAILADTLAEMRARRALVIEWMAGEDRLEWNEPAGGVVGFVRMRGNPPGGTEGFYDRLLNTHGTYVAPGHWFDLPDRYFRLGFGWPQRGELEAGLKAISAALCG